MFNLNISTMVYRPVRQVFDFISAPENDFQWQYGTLAAARLSEGVSEVGTFFRSIGHLMGRRVESTYEVTEFEPNRKYGFKSLTGPLQSQTTFTFETDKGSTHIDLSSQVSVDDLLQLNEEVLEKKMRKQFKENLALLKNLLEARRILSATEAGALAGGIII
jgi:hypothetical protein